jgi:hypothetical protein
MGLNVEAQKKKSEYADVVLKYRMTCIYSWWFFIYDFLQDNRYHSKTTTNAMDVARLDF